MKRVTRMLAVAVFVSAVATIPASASHSAVQPPQVTSPADPDTDPPTIDIWKGLDCECQCECCNRLKERLKKLLAKSPYARPMLSPNAGDESTPKVKARSSHHDRSSRRRATRIRHVRRSGPSKYSRPWPSSGNSWLDAARTHKLRKARHARRKAGRLGLTPKQRDEIEALRQDRRLDTIDLKAALEKQEIELRRLMRDEPVDEAALRKAVDAAAKLRADIRFRKLRARIETRRLLTPEQLENLKRAK